MAGHEDLAPHKGVSKSPNATAKPTSTSTTRGIIASPKRSALTIPAEVDHPPRQLGHCAYQSSPGAYICRLLAGADS